MSEASTPSRPKLQIKEGAPESVLMFLQSYPSHLFVTRDGFGNLTESSQRGLSMVRAAGVGVREVEVEIGGSLETALQKFSGWQYFPQLYVGTEFIGGNTVIEEFFNSGECDRLLKQDSKLSTSGVGIRPRKPTLKSVWKLCLSHRGDYLAAARANGTVEIVSICDNQSRLLMSHCGWVNAVAFDREGDRLFSGGTDTAIRVWNVVSGKLTTQFGGHSRWVNGIEVDPQGRYVASVGADRFLRLWNASTLNVIGERQVHIANIWSVFAIGDLIITGAEDGTIAAIEYGNDLHLRNQFQAHRNVVTSIASALEPGAFCTASVDGKVYGWALDGVLARQLFRFDAHFERVWCVESIPTYAAMASASADKTVRIWEPTDGREIVKFSYPAQPLSLCYLKHTQTLVVGLEDGSLLWHRL